MPQPQAGRQKTSGVSDNYEAGGVAIVCTKPVKKWRDPNERTSRKGGRSERAGSSPACCRERCEHPPEYTVFECRIDGNRPVAQVVQVPSDTTDSVLKNKTCMLLETKQSEHGPTSRIAAYPAEASSRTSRNRPQPTGAMSFALESRDSPGGAVACAGKFAEHMDERSPISFAQPVTTLETTKGPACANGPSSRLVYGPVPEAVIKTSGTHRTPAFHIQCSTTPEGPIARVTQIPREFTKSSGDPGTCYETFVKHDGSCPTAMVTRSNRMDECQKACGVLETWVDSSGPRARALALPEELSNVRHFTHLQVHSKDDGPSAKVTQQPGDMTKIIPNLRGNDDGPQGPNLCPCNYQTSSPLKRPAIPHPTERRNGLSPTSSELKCRVGLFKDNRFKKGKTSATSNTCPAHCCPPVSCTGQGTPVFQIQPATCAPERSPSTGKPSGPPVPRPGACHCPVRPCFKSPTRSRSEMHPLPGGTVFPQCPAPSLPDIAPVPLGSNRFRDYKPRSKNPAPRRTTGFSPPRPKQRPKVDGKSKKPTKSAATKSKKKNKKTGPPKEIIEASDSWDDDKEKELTTVSEETLYVECPAFASKASKSVQVCEEPSYVTCPAFESKGNQASLICEESSNVKCPAFESKGNQTVAIRGESTYVECPAFKSTITQSAPRFEEPTYVPCPAFATEKSSKASTVYMPREDLLNVKYPEYFLRPKALETSEVCRVERHGSKCHQCDFSIPDGGCRTSYEQRQDRNARTLISSGRRRRRFTDDFNEVPSRTYCERGSKNQKQEHDKRPEKEHGAVSPPKNNKKGADEEEKLEKIIHDSSDGKKAKIKLRAVKSRELLAGVVYYDCDCYHRNGLQQDCPRGECRGTKRCLAKPWPDCDMARYFRWKWGRYYKLLDLIPPSTFCGPRDVLFQAKVGRENGPRVEKKCEKSEKPSRVEPNPKNGEKKAVTPKGRHRRKCRDLENYQICQKYALIPVVADDSYDR